MTGSPASLQLTRLPQRPSGIQGQQLGREGEAISPVCLVGQREPEEKDGTKGKGREPVQAQSPLALCSGLMTTLPH